MKRPAESLLSGPSCQSWSGAALFLEILCCFLCVSSLAVIGDLFKTEVYELARYINRDREIIPAAILSKAPSAELRPDQTDQDSLPAYDVLDRILHRYLVQSRTYQEIVELGFDRSVVSDVLRMVGRAEYKRRQAPPVIRVSSRAFGTGRRMPIARHIYEDRV